MLMNNRNVGLILPRFLTIIGLITLSFFIVELPVHGFLSTYLGTFVSNPEILKGIKDIPNYLLFLIYSIFLLLNFKQIKSLLKDKVILLMMLYLAFVVLISVTRQYYTGGLATLIGFLFDTRYVVIAFNAYILFRFGDFDRQWFLYVFTRVLLIEAAILVILGFLQVYVLPRDFLTQFGYVKYETIAPYIEYKEGNGILRAYATTRGPNEYGAFMVFAFAISMAVKRRPIRRFLMAFLLLGILLSGSRAALIASIISFCTYLAYKYGSKVLFKRKVIFGAFVTILLIITILFASYKIPAIRLTIFHSDSSSSSLVEGSTEKHVFLAMEGIEYATSNLLGCGVGCAGPASRFSSEALISESYVVQIAQELGLIGLIIWVAMQVTLIAELIKNRSKGEYYFSIISSFYGITFIALVLHIWTDELVALTWWMFAGCLLGNEEYRNLLLRKMREKKKHNKKATRIA